MSAFGAGHLSVAKKSETLLTVRLYGIGGLRHQPGVFVGEWHDAGAMKNIRPKSEEVEKTKLHERRETCISSEVWGSLDRFPDYLAYLAESKRSNRSTWPNHFGFSDPMCPNDYTQNSENTSPTTGLVCPHNGRKYSY